MPFNTNELSAASGAPIELYKFIGTFNTWRVTSYLREITNSDGTYEPVPVKRTQIENASQDQEELAIDISLPYDHPLALEYIFAVSPPELSVEIYRAHRDDFNDTLLLWTGKPISFNVEGRVASLRVPSIFSYLLSGLCPAPRYQAPCNHILYDDRCKVNRAANSQTVDVVSVSASGRRLTLSANTFANGECNAGEMIWTAGGQRRMITLSNGTTFDISYPFAGDPTGDEVIIRKGCDHSFTTCKNKFSNGLNYGGCPIVPPTNPFNSRL